VGGYEDALMGQPVRTRNVRTGQSELGSRIVRRTFRIRAV
jgi:hypothetical protein